MEGQGCRDEENRRWYVDRGGLPVRRRCADRRYRAGRGRGPYRRPGRGRGVAACGPAQLRVGVPEQIPGDPQRGMDKQSWNIVLRNTGTVSCSLRGWPALTARASTGRAVPLAVRDAAFSNLAAVPDRQVILAPGDAAVVTAMSADEQRGCTISWTLAVRLPGSASAVAVPAPHGVFVPCLGGPLALSPFYPLAALGAGHQGHERHQRAAAVRRVGRRRATRLPGRGTAGEPCQHRAGRRQRLPGGAAAAHRRAAVHAERGLAHGAAGRGGRPAPGREGVLLGRRGPGGASGDHHLRAGHQPARGPDAAARHLGVGRGGRGGHRDLPAR